MNKQKLVVRLFIFLFSVSISVTVLPCGIINTHGLFGEITSSVVTDDKDSSTNQEYNLFETKKQIKEINIYNIWFEIWTFIILVKYAQYLFRLPREDTIVSLKVRMNN